MHYFKKNIGDYAKKTGRLSMLQHGAYTLLIDSCYDRERFPTLDDAIEWTWASSKEEIEAVEFVLRRFFVLEDGVYVQSRIREEIAEYHAKATTNKRIAEEREAKRKSKDTTGTRSVHESSPDVNEAPPNHKPITINQEPTTNNQKPSSVSKDTGVKTPLSPDEIIFGYGVPLLVSGGTAEKQARSFLGGLRKVHGDETLVNTLRECIKAKPLQPLEWLAKALPPDGIKPKLNKQEALEASNRAVVQRLLKKEGLA
jgi:uncharacterized protein YdaU (DUF1376 family)